ncbi:hypothetical protein rtp18 [Escherichia phage Rtp]|uniref:Uncharacterized protein n=1 Tax=Escherichia phage Rtp TaxID=2994041 RepID=Q333G6_9CAUD|nr:hypothetical protein rtp18 [Escherichia phage Rtp]CAJ42222.1 hypothetical protein [Escherichia phage Rtp]
MGALVLTHRGDPLTRRRLKIITLKAIHKDGSEQVFEVHKFGYNVKSNRIDAVDDAGPFTICMGELISVVYAMNSRGSTVGRYFNTGIDRAKAE